MPKEKKSNSMTTDLKAHPLANQMPIPPDFLLKSNPNKNQFSPPPVGAVEVISQPKTIDYLSYQSALEDRRQAEINLAQVYSQYLELVSYNEKLLRSLARYNRFKARARRVFDRTVEGQENLLAAEKTLTGLQIENESLNQFIQSHEETMQQTTSQLRDVQKTAEAIKNQNALLRDELENRGLLLKESERQINNYVTQIECLGDIVTQTELKISQIQEENLALRNDLRERQIVASQVEKMKRVLNEMESKAARIEEENLALQNVVHEGEKITIQMTQMNESMGQMETKLSELSEENACLQSELRERQIIDGGIVDLNQELTATVSKLQRQIMDIEDKLRNERVKTNRPRNFTLENHSIIEAPLETTSLAELTEAVASPQDKTKIEDFVSRWSQIIDELSSQATPLKENKKGRTKHEQLLSEHGDLEVI